MKEIIQIIKFIINHPIGKRRMLKSLSRFIYWQIFSRLKIAKYVFNFIEQSESWSPNLEVLDKYSAKESAKKLVETIEKTEK